MKCLYFSFVLLCYAIALYPQVSYYVSPDGDDSNNGLSISTPFRTIQRAVDMMFPGDTVFLLQGVYTQQDTAYAFVRVNKSGTDQAYLTIKAYPGHQPVIQFRGWHGILIEGANYVQIEGLLIQGNNNHITLSYAQSQAHNLNNPLTSGHGIGITWKAADSLFSEHITIRGCTIYDCGGSAIYWLMADWITIVDNVIYNCTTYSPHGTSALMQLRPRRSDFTARPKMRIERNLIFNNVNLIPNALTFEYDGGHAIYINNSYPIPISLCYYTGRTLIANNIILRNGGAAIFAEQSDQIWIFHNTTLENDKSNQGTGECFLRSLTGVEVFHNCFIPVSSNIAVQAENIMLLQAALNAYPQSATCAIWSDEDVYVEDVGFVYLGNDPLEADFHLVVNSPLIDQAGADTLVDVDFFRQVRPIGLRKDIGAVEYNPAYRLPEISVSDNFQIIIDEHIIRILSTVPMLQIEFFDVQGKRTYGCSLQGGYVALMDSQDISSGLYLIRVRTENKVDVRKILVR